MGRFLQNFDRISFWLGFLAATLFWWLAIRFRPALTVLFTSLISRLRSAFQEAGAGLEVRLCNDVLHQAERLHLAAELFSLDEILLPPRLLAPPRPVIPGEAPRVEPVASLAVPNTAGWPTLPSLYGAPRLSLAEAMSGGCNVVICGRPGSGKSTALADLAIQAARRYPLPGDLAERIPLLLFAADFLKVIPEPLDITAVHSELAVIDPAQALEVLAAAAGARSSLPTQARLPQFLRQAVYSGRLLLLIDGMDELPPHSFDRIVSYLNSLTAAFPALRMAVSASDKYLGKLRRLGFAVLAMAEWDRSQRIEFINKWGSRWQALIAASQDSGSPVDALLLNSWVGVGVACLTPLELTLKVWAAFAGDALGPGPVEAIEAFVRRQLAAGEQPTSESARPALEALALICLTSENPYPFANDIQTAAPAAGIDPESLLALPPASESGLLRAFSGGRIGFSHPTMLSFLGACALEARLLYADTLERSLKPVSRPWPTQQQALGFLTALLDPDQKTLQPLLDSSKPPLHPELLEAAYWLRYATETANWRTPVMRRLAPMLSDESLSLSIRCSILTALLLSGAAGLEPLLRQLCQNSNASQRQLGALGYGLLQEVTELDDLNKLLSDPHPNVYRAACLALVSIGSGLALELVAEALLHGDDELRRAAAEALANDPVEGHPTLEEGAALDDLLVRRAVVYGLQRTGRSWASLLLEKMRMEDEQWVVKNAANQALEELNEPDAQIPVPHPPLQDTPWLLAYAGQHGVGMSSSRAAREMLLQSLSDGSEEHKLAAMYELSRLLDPGALPLMLDLLHGYPGELVESAYQALWLMYASGIDLSQTDQ